MRPRRSLGAVAITLLLVLGLSGAACSSSSKAKAKAAVSKVATNGAAVQISGFAFKSPAANVKLGSTVTWTNKDSATHTVSSTSGPVSFDSGDLGSGKTFSTTFTKAGTYAYICRIHKGMKGVVVVTG